MLKDLLRGVASKLVTVSFKGTQSDWTLHFMSVADIPRPHRWISTQRSDRFVLLKQHQHLSTSGKISCRVEQWSFRRHQKAAGSTICPFFNEAIFSKPKHAIETVTLAADRCHQDEGDLQIRILTQVSKNRVPSPCWTQRSKNSPFGYLIVYFEHLGHTERFDWLSLATAGMVITAVSQVTLRAVAGTVQNLTFK